MFYAICGCDNYYMSYERMSRPDLNGKSIVILNSNDGYVVARNKEARQTSVKAGLSYYQMKEQFPGKEAAVFFNNYKLYSELTTCVMTITKDAAPQMFHCPIDECFCLLSDMSFDEPKKQGEDLHRHILKHTGPPVNIGMTRTKTLAKAVGHFAKKHEGYRHCCIIDTKEKRIKALQLFPVGEVWRVRHRNTPKLLGMGDKMAHDFADHPKKWVRSLFRVTGVRTWVGFNGEGCISGEEPAKKKSVYTSHSFTGTISGFETVRACVSNFAVHCLQKLRRQRSVVSVVSVFIHTNQFRKNQQQYWNSREVTLLTPSNPTQQIVQVTAKILQGISVPGLQYRKAEAIVIGIMSDSAVQTDFIDYNRDKMGKQTRLDQMINRLNKLGGSGLVVLEVQQHHEKDKQDHRTAFTDAIRYDFRSKNPTTRWSDIIALK